MTDKEEVYDLLASKFLTYRDLLKADIIENGEKMISLSNTSIKSTFFDERMRQFNGEDIYIREGLVARLERAQGDIERFLPGCTLDVFYGYRHPKIQSDSFEIVKKNILSKKPEGWDELSLNEAAHHFIAVPEVAGHPTGGAVDVRIIGPDGVPLDMGTPPHDFTKNSYVFSPYISKESWLNRQKLRQCMTAAGFCPFDGEWWHFSYGDREWAIYYKKPHAIYNQIEFSI